MGLLDRFKTSPKDRYARLALTLAYAAGHRDAYYDPDNFAIVIGPGRRMNLGNLFAESSGLTTLEKRDALNRLIRVMTQPRVDYEWHEAMPKLRAVIRGATFGLTMDANRTPVRRPFLPFVCEMLVLDEPDSMRYVAPGNLDGWGVTAEAAFRAGRDNIARRAAGFVERIQPAQKAGLLVRMVDDGNGYFSSFLLVEGWLAQAATAYGMPVIATVPADNGLTLAVGGVEIAGPLVEMSLAEYDTATRRVSPCAYAADESGQVKPLRLRADHPAAAITARSALILASTEYATQQKFLSAVFERSQTPVFVSTFGAFEKPEQIPISVCSWTDGIEQLLPRTDYVHFTRGGVAGPRVPWHVVAEHVDLNPDPAFDPPRYRVGDWPDATVMAELAKHAA